MGNRDDRAITIFVSPHIYKQFEGDKNILTLMAQKGFNNECIERGVKFAELGKILEMKKLYGSIAKCYSFAWECKPMGGQVVTIEYWLKQMESVKEYHQLMCEIYPELSPPKIEIKPPAHLKNTGRPQ